MAGQFNRYIRGKVTPSQELCLQQHKEFLMEEMDSRELVYRLRSQFILSSSDEELILGAEGIRQLTRKDQNGRLVDIITMRSSKGFEAFLQALQDTGHEKAYKTLRDTLNRSEGIQEEDGASGPAENLDADEEEDTDEDNVDILWERVSTLSNAVEDIKRRIEVLSRRLTRVDSGRQAMIDELREELALAQSKIDCLLKENENLSSLVAEKSQQLEEAQARVTELEQKLAKLETENDNLQRKVREQSKKMENMNTRFKQVQTKVNSLEQELNVQKQEHKKEMDEQKQLQRREAEQNRRKLEREQQKHEATEMKMTQLEERMMGEVTKMGQTLEKLQQNSGEPLKPEA